MLRSRWLCRGLGPGSLRGSLSLDFHSCGGWQPAPVRKYPNPSSAGGSLQQPGSGLRTCSLLRSDTGARLNHHVHSWVSPVCACGKKHKSYKSVDVFLEQFSGSCFQPGLF